MSDQKKPIINPQLGFSQNLTNRLKLIFRLLADRRINPFLKLLPIGSVVYLVIPDIFLGPIDDALLIWLGTFLFVELCPPDIVQEHMDRLQQESTGIHHSPTGHGSTISDDDIVDAEYWEEEQD